MQEIPIASRLPSSTSSTIVHRSGIPSVPFWSLRYIRYSVPIDYYALAVSSARFSSLYTIHPTPRQSRPTPYTLHLTQQLAAFLYTLHPTQVFRHLSCVRRWLAVSSLFPCQSVLIRGRYVSRHLFCFCQWSGNIFASFLVLPLAVFCSRLSPRVFPTPHLSPIASKRRPIAQRPITFHLSPSMSIVQIIRAFCWSLGLNPSL